jgi:hypothetical protein
VTLGNLVELTDVSVECTASIFRVNSVSRMRKCVIDIGWEWEIDVRTVPTEGKKGL